MQVLVGLSLTVLSCCRIHPRMHSLLYIESKAVFLIRAQILEVSKRYAVSVPEPWVTPWEGRMGGGHRAKRQLWNTVERGLDLGLGNRSVLWRVSKPVQPARHAGTHGLSTCSSLRLELFSLPANLPATPSSPWTSGSCILAVRLSLTAQHRQPPLSLCPLFPFPVRFFLSLPLVPLTGHIFHLFDYLWPVSPTRMCAVGGQGFLFSSCGIFSP